MISVGFAIVTVGCAVYPAPAFLIVISDIVLSARTVTSGTADIVLFPVIVTTGFSLYQAPLFDMVKSTIPKLLNSTAAVAAAPTPPPPVMETNGACV